MELVDDSHRLVYDMIRVDGASDEMLRMACSGPWLPWDTFRQTTFYGAITYHGTVPLDSSKPWNTEIRTEPNILPYDVCVYDPGMNVVSVSHKRTLEDAKREFESYAENGRSIGLVEISFYAPGHPMLLDATKLNPNRSRVTIRDPVRVHVPSNEPEEERRRVAMAGIPTEASDGEVCPVPVHIPASKKRDRVSDKGKEEEDDEDDDEQEQIDIDMVDDNGNATPPSLNVCLDPDERDCRADYIEAELRRIGIDHRKWLKNRKEFEKRCKKGIPSRLTKWTELFTDDAIKWSKDLVELMTHTCQAYDRVYCLTRTSDTRIWIKGHHDKEAVLIDGLVKLPSTFKCRCLKTMFTVVPDSRYRPVLFHFCDPIQRTRARMCSECMIMSWMTSISMLLLDTGSDPQDVQYTDLEARCETRCGATWKLLDLVSMYADHSHGIPIRLIPKALAEGKKQRRRRAVDDGEPEDSE